MPRAGNRSLGNTLALQGESDAGFPRAGVGVGGGIPAGDSRVHNVWFSFSNIIRMVTRTKTLKNLANGLFERERTAVARNWGKTLSMHAITKHHQSTP